MNFTKTPPTTPGFYAWRKTGSEDISTTKVISNDSRWSSGTIYLREAQCAYGGEWCRLVPSEEVEVAYADGWLDAVTLPMGYDEAWNNSRAKRVAEGKD